MPSIVASAIDHIGLTRLGNRFGVGPSAVQKWRDRKRLPQTDLSGLTQYAAGIEELSAGKYSAQEMLDETRAAWQRNGFRRGKRRRAARAS